MSDTRERSARWHVGCDRCGAGGWIGRRAGGVDAWCEACQRPAVLAGEAPGTAPPCPACGAPLSIDALRSEELYGQIQHLVAVLMGWRGDPAPLAALLPDRPRFLTDLTPPDPAPDDDAATGEALRALAAGQFPEARARLEAALRGARGATRLWRALAIAYERLREPGFAEWAWTQALEREDLRVARLARGALRARRGEFEGARADLAAAGDGTEARWNRAALAVLEAVAGTPGLPEPEVLARARAEAGEVTSYWSHPTVGRLLWTLLVERARARAAPGRSACPDERVLRAAEGELEFDTFWDRALVVHGYAATGLTAEAARAGSALARELVEALAAEPCLAGAPARPIADPGATAGASIRAGDPAAAHAAHAPLLARTDLARYRVPCAHCADGTVGVDQVGEDTSA